MVAQMDDSWVETLVGKLAAYWAFLSVENAVVQTAEMMVALKGDGMVVTKVALKGISMVYGLVARMVDRKDFLVVEKSVEN